MSVGWSAFTPPGLALENLDVLLTQIFPLHHIFQGVFQSTKKSVLTLVKHECLFVKDPFNHLLRHQATIKRFSNGEYYNIY